MALFPSQPDQASPTWGQAYGLLSFQVTGVLISSVLNAFIAIDEGILSSLIMTTLFSVLYVKFAEGKVPGALSQRRLRVGLALRASLLLAVIGLATTAVYDGAHLLESDRIGLQVTLIASALVISYLTMWVGLEIGAWWAKREGLRH
jgi:hypothetical protein